MADVILVSGVQDPHSLRILVADVVAHLSSAAVDAGLSPEDVTDALTAGLETASMMAARANLIAEAGAPDDVRLVSEWLQMTASYIADACDVRGIEPATVVAGMRQGCYAIATAMAGRYPEAFEE